MLLRFFLLVCVVSQGVLHPRNTVSQEAKRPFTVADDIRFSYFGDPFTDKAEAILHSPDRRYVVVQTEHGRLDLNRCESTVRVYAGADVRRFLSSSPSTPAPPPIWTFSRATSRDGPVISSIRWLRDSSGFGFLEKSASGKEQLYLADLRSRTVRSLTPAEQSVRSFDIRDSSHFVYTVLSPSIRERIESESHAESVVATGRRIFSLLSPAAAMRWHDLGELWGVIGSRRVRIDDPASHKPLSIYARGQMALALSPDGHTVVTALPLPDVPVDWEALYAPPFPGDARHIQAGPQDLSNMDGAFDVSRYALIDLATGVVQAMPFGPLGYEADWIGLPHTDWSQDGTRIVVTDTFLEPSAAHSAGQSPRPCAAVIDVKGLRTTCVEAVFGSRANGLLDPGFRLVTGVFFDPGNRDRLTVREQYPGGVNTQAVYRLVDGKWQLEQNLPDSETNSAVRLSVRENVNDPPVLMATDKSSGASRILWNPNPWLANVDLTRVEIYRWKDEAGRELVGGLYEPRGYDPGKHYPLVIQAHGFSADRFVPSGVYPTGFAARELAAQGFLVLQARGCPVRRNPEEGPCQVEAYESAVRKLEAEGRIDPERIGIVGFSRTCYYTLEALTTSRIHFSAASITDGVDMGYIQYLTEDNSLVQESDGVIGAPPFGRGLDKWIERSPEFNMDKVTAPLLVVGVGEGGALNEWEPYATLWRLHKPVDFLLLKNGTHPLTNPAQRMISQSSTVDWMRFWLVHEEDSDPQKLEQYRRWNRIRNIENLGSPVSVGSAD